MDESRITKSSGNVFVDLGFPPDEAVILSMRADLMAQLRALMDRKKWTQVAAASRLQLAQSLISDLRRGKWEKFSLEMLLILAARAGLHLKLEISKVT